MNKKREWYWVWGYMCLSAMMVIGISCEMNKEEEDPAPRS